MSVRVMSWVWENSTADPTDRLVLLAIADCANDSGAEAYPSLATLAKKTGLALRSVQRAIKQLVADGAMIVQPNAGPHGCNRYRITMITVSPPSESHPDTVTPRQADTPSESRPTPVTVTPLPSHSVTTSLVTVSPEPSLNHPLTVSEPSKAVAVANGATITQRSKRITDAYAKIEPMCRWPAVNGIVMKAIKAERWSDNEILAALLRLAGEGRSVTVETLRIELNGLPPARAAPKPSTTDSRVDQALKLAAELERQEIEA